MNEIQAPQPIQPADLFLAGGIMGAENWQPKAIQLLANVPGILLNPRRDKDFATAMHQPQVEWEHYALKASNSILFWFPPETLCPITLFELGVWSNSSKPIFVGTHPEYKRREDITYQLQLSRPEVTIFSTLEDTIADYVKTVNNTLA